MENYLRSPELHTPDTISDLHRLRVENEIDRLITLREI